MKNIAVTVCLSVIALSALGGDMSNSIELTQLYIVGDATHTAWDLGKADEMHRIDEGVFEWTGELAGGKDFKFMNSRDGWHKHIVATSADCEIQEDGVYHLAFYADWGLDGKYDCKFHVARTGRYTIIADLNSMRMTLTEPVATAPWPEKFYLTGTSVDNRVIEIPGRYGTEHKSSVYLKPGKIKLMDTPSESSETRYFRPGFEDLDVTFGTGYHTPLFEYDGTSDYGWNVALEGYYTIYLDNARQTYCFRRLAPVERLYLVGGCCERAWNYWDKSNCEFRPSPDDPYVMVWEGELRIGWEKKSDPDGTTIDPDEPDKFKILTAQDWFRDTYHPYVADVSAVGTSDARITGGDDLKWTIPGNGLYHLELNLRTETLTGTLLEAASTEEKPADPDSAAIESVSPDEESGRVCYYDIRGNLVMNPTDGIFIEVSDDSVRKLLIR